MKYEKTDSFESTDELDRLIEEAIDDVKDTEAEDFLDADDNGVDLSDELDRRIHKLIAKKSAKEIFWDRVYPKLLSTAALATFVFICVAWIGMMSAFGDENHPTYTEPHENTFETVLLSDTVLSQSESTTSSEFVGTPTKELQTDLQGTTEIKPGQSETPVPEGFVSPDDEIRAFYIITHGNSDGVFLKITISGYQSKSLGKEFYVKSNEYIVVDLEVTNKSAKTLYRSLPKECLNADPSHNHGISLDLSSRSIFYGTYSLCPSTIGYHCDSESTLVPWQSGETLTYRLKYAVGEEVSDGFDLPAEGNDYPAGIKLYDNTIYNNNSCEFHGYLNFHYCNTKFFSSTSFPQSLSLEVVYVAPQTEQN